MVLWSVLAAPGLIAAGLYLTVGRGLVADSPQAVLPGVVLAACGVLAWFSEGPTDRALTGRRIRREGDAVVVVLHRWVGPAGAVVALAAGAYAVQVAATSSGGSRALASLAAIVALLVLPDLLSFAVHPARVVLGPDRLGLRSRTHEASVAWETIVAAGPADRHPSAPGVAVTTGQPIDLRRRWLLLPLGRRSRADRFVVSARFSDHPGELEAAIEALAHTPTSHRREVLDRLAGDLGTGSARRGSGPR